MNVVALLTVAMLAFAPQDAATQAAAPVVVVWTIDGSEYTGTLATAFPQLTLATEAGPRALPWDAVERVVLRVPAAAAPAGAPGWRWELADGSALLLDRPTATDSGIQAAFGDGLAATIPRDVVQRIVMSPLPASATDVLAEAAAEASASAEAGDLVIVAGTQRALALRGQVRQFTEAGVSFVFREQQRVLPWPRVAAICFPAVATRDASCRVTLATGDIIAGRVTGGDAEALAITSSTLGQLALPWRHVREIACRSSRVEWLSDLQPLRYEFVPLLDRRWPFAVDQNLLGDALRVGDGAYAKGLCLHSRAGLVFRLAGGYQRFRSIVGIDAAFAPRGAAEVQIVADGRTLWRDVVRGDSPPHDVDLDVSGVQDVLLFVDFGPDLDLADHVCFAEARLIR